MKPIEQCVFCGCKDVPEEVVSLPVYANGEKVDSISVLGWKCSQCGEEYYLLEDLKQAENWGIEK